MEHRPVQDRSGRNARGSTDEGVASEIAEVASLLVALEDWKTEPLRQCAEKCGLSTSQAEALLSVDGSTSMRELADRLGRHPSNITGIVDRLTARGLVERRNDDADRRIRRIALTPVGESLRQTLRSCVQNAPGPYQRLTPDQRCRLRELLRLAVDPVGTQSRSHRAAAKAASPVAKAMSGDCP